MPGLLDSPLAFMLIVIVMVFAFVLVPVLASFRQARRAQADATLLARERLEAQVALKRELIQRGLPPHELEQTIKLLKLDELAEEPPDATSRGRNARKSEQQLEADILEGLALLDGVSPEDVEQSFALLRGADREKKMAVLDLVGKLRFSSAEASVILAAVRSLCQPAETPREELPSLEISSHIKR